jgi:hypothetical protein
VYLVDTGHFTLSHCAALPLNICILAKDGSKVVNTSVKWPLDKEGMLAHIDRFLVGNHPGADAKRVSKENSRQQWHKQYRQPGSKGESMQSIRAKVLNAAA